MSPAFLAISAAVTKPATTAAVVEGEFRSFFSGKKSPLIEKPKEQSQADSVDSKEDKKESVVVTTIEKSPQSARLVVFGTNEFVADDTIQIHSMLGGNQYLKSVQMVENTLDYSTSDQTLLAIRTRGHFARTLLVKDSDKTFWEMVNYGFAVFGLLLVYFAVANLRRKNLREQNKKLSLA